MNMENVIESKSFHFATRIVKLAEYLELEKKAYVLARQILKSGTSIGANVAEAHYAQSTADFISKMSIALKETNETDYWLHLLQDTGYLTGKETESLRADCAELNKILSSIVKTAKEK